MSDEPTTSRELRRKGHSWRNHEPQDIIDIAENEGDTAAREALRFIEAGRMYEMLQRSYDFFVPLDPDERAAWADANPDLVEWVGVYAAVEHLNTVEEHTGVESLI